MRRATAEDADFIAERLVRQLAKHPDIPTRDFCDVQTSGELSPGELDKLVDMVTRRLNRPTVAV